MAIFLSGRLYAQIIHDDFLSGIDAELILPAGADSDLIDEDLLLFRRRDIGLILSWHTFDAKYLLADSGVALSANALREVTALIHEGHRHPQADAVLKTHHTVEHNFIEFVPCGVIIRASHDDSFFNAPCFAEESVPDDLILHAIILRINASRQNEDARRQLYRLTVFVLAVVLAASEQRILILNVAAVFPRLTEAGVENDLHLFRAAKRIEIFQDDRFPRSPLADESVQPERTGSLAVGFRILGNPFCRGAFHLRFRGNAAAAGAGVVHLLDLVGLLVRDDDFVVLKANIRPADFVVLAAMRAFGVPPLHRACVVGSFDGAGIFDCRS